MKSVTRPTLCQLFALSLLALAAMLTALFYVVFDSSRAMRDRLLIVSLGLIAALRCRAIGPA